MVLCLILTGYLRFLILQAPSKAVRPTPVFFFLYRSCTKKQLPGVAAARPPVPYPWVTMFQSFTSISQCWSPTRVSEQQCGLRLIRLYARVSPCSKHTVRSNSVVWKWPQPLKFSVRVVDVIREQTGKRLLSFPWSLSFHAGQSHGS